MSESGHARSYTDDEILSHIRRVADGDRPPTMEEFNADDQAPSTTAVVIHFGKWNNAIKTAGFEPRAHGPDEPANKISREELISWLQAFQFEFGVWPRIDDIRQWPGPSETPYQREFGSMSDAISAAKEEMNDA